MNPLTGILNTRGPLFSTDMCPLTGTREIGPCNNSCIDSETRSYAL